MRNWRTTAHRRLYDGSLLHLFRRGKSNRDPNFRSICVKMLTTLAMKMMRMGELKINTGKYVTKNIVLAYFSLSLRESSAQRNTNLNNS